MILMHRFIYQPIYSKIYLDAEFKLQNYKSIINLRTIFKKKRTQKMQMQLAVIHCLTAQFVFNENIRKMCNIL